MGRSAEYIVTCSERKDLILLYAADQLEPAEAEALREHLATDCPICTGALAEAEATLAQVALSIDPIAPSPEAREKLMSRIAATRSRATQSTALQGRGPSPLRIFATAILSAAAAVVITSAIFVSMMRDATRRKPTLEMVSMTSEIQPKAHGAVAWDMDHHEWHVAVFNLAPLPAGKEYELWIIPPGKAPMRSKTFTVDASGTATLIVPVPADIGAIATAAITDEPTGGVDKPTGKIQLAGKSSG
jgi:anti-sigma-K factor RskA